MYRGREWPELIAALASPPGEFPRRLSETGLFAEVARLVPAPGVLPYKINVPGGHDGAASEHHLALPRLLVEWIASLRP